jgi:hypothetical protein
MKIVQKNKEMALFFVYNFEFTTLSTQKHRHPFIFGQILIICTPFNENCLTILIFFSKSNSTTAARLASFSKYKTKIGSCSVNFCRILKIRASFRQKLFHKSEPVLEIKIGQV